MSKKALIIIAAVLAVVLIGLVIICFLPSISKNNEPTLPTEETVQPTVPTEEPVLPETVPEETLGAIITPDEPILQVDDEPIENDPEETNATEKPNKPTKPDTPSKPTTAPTTGEPDETEQIFKITYEGLEGAAHSNPDTYTIKTAASIILAAPSTRAGYTFDGWYLDGKKVTSLENCSGDLKIIAVWKSKSIELPDVPF